MLYVFLPITFVVAFNFGLLAGCILSSRRIEKAAEQRTSLSTELRDLKTSPTEKNGKSKGSESQEFLLQQPHSAPLA